MFYAKATAPGFSETSSVVESPTRLPSIYDRWMAAVRSFVQAAQASLSAMIVDWTPNGVTHTGTSVPATPSNEYIMGGCGTSQSVFALAAGDVQNISIYFFGKRLTKEYRWVVDTPYTPPGFKVKIYTDSIAGYPADYQAMINSWANAISGLTATTLDSLQTQVNAAMNSFTGATYQLNTPSRTFTYTSGGTSGYSITGGIQDSQSPYNVSSINFAVIEASVATDGVWHQEYRTSNPEPYGPSCAKAEYVSSSDPSWDPITGPGKTTVRMDSMSGNGILGQRAPIVNIGNMCGSGFPITSYYKDLDFDNTPIPGYNKAGKYHPAVEFTYTTPGANFLIQQGDPFSSYSETQGMYVLDLYYKKWGKCKETFSSLIDLTPLNIPSPSSLGTTDIGMNAAVFKTNKIRLFDTEPAESMIRYGKIGYVRLGVTHLLEEHLHFKRDFYGSVTIESSLDGRNIDVATIHTNTFFGTKHAILYPNIRYKWHNVVITGVYDMQYLETRGNISGRR